MRIAVYRVPGRTHEDHLCAMQKGMAKHGVQTEFFSDLPSSDNFDAVVVWGWKVGLRVRGAFHGPILVMERGYLGDRFNWTSCGWDGLNGRARFTQVDDARRFDRHFSHLLKDWRQGGDYTLIAGQVLGDASLAHVDIHRWYKEMGVRLWRAGMNPMFRQHPVEVRRGVALPTVPFAEFVDGTLEDTLSVSSLFVAYNSNSAVDAVLSGCPIHVEDIGSMVYDLASHDLTKIRPDRERRLQQIAWCQFPMDELKSGYAWDIARQSMRKE